MRFHIRAVAFAAALASALVPAAARAQQPAPATEAQAHRDVATAVHRRAEALSRRVAFHLDEARRDGDARRAQCLDDVLSQVNATLRMIVMRIERLEEAIRVGDAARRRHQVYVLGVLEQRIAELDAATRACNGDRAGPARGTRVIVTIDRDVPREDPTRFRRADGFGLPYIPPPASPAI